MTYAKVINGEIVEYNRTLPFTSGKTRFEAHMTQEEMKRFGYLPLVGTEPIYDRDTHRVNDVSYTIGDNEVTKVYNVVEIPIEDIVAKARETMTNAVQTLVDNKAREFRWDDIKSARAGAGVPLEGTESVAEIAIHTEAVKLAKWDRAVWAKAGEIEAEVLAGTREIPTVEELLAELPVLV